MHDTKTIGLSKRKQLILKVCSVISMIVLSFTLSILVLMPEIGLKILWALLIPIAPLIFLLAPNLWASVCPMAISQNIPKRLNRSKNILLSKKQIKQFNLYGIVFLFLLVPMRHTLFNQYAWVCIGIIFLLLIVSFLLGYNYSGMSGWCMGLCPIRPVELLYGQFSFQTNRSELCNHCSSCVSNCPRSNIKRPEALILYNNYTYWFAYAFPGFILMYFQINAETSLFSAYGKIIAGMLLSYTLFYGLNKKMVYERFILLPAAVSFFIYYYFSIPAVLKEWNLNTNLNAIFMAIPILTFGFAIFSFRKKISQAV